MPTTETTAANLPSRGRYRKHFSDGSQTVDPQISLSLSLSCFSSTIDLFCKQNMYEIRYMSVWFTEHSKQ